MAVIGINKGQRDVISHANRAKPLCPLLPRLPLFFAFLCEYTRVRWRNARWKLSDRSTAIPLPVKKTALCFWFPKWASSRAFQSAFQVKLLHKRLALDVQTSRADLHGSANLHLSQKIESSHLRCSKLANAVPGTN